MPDVSTTAMPSIYRTLSKNEYLRVESAGDSPSVNGILRQNESDTEVDVFRGKEVTLRQNTDRTKWYFVDDTILLQINSTKLPLGTHSWYNKILNKTEELTMIKEIDTFKEFDGIQNRVTGGLEYDGAMPWLLSISIANRHICGATLIHPLWAVTAAHCISWQTRCHPQRLQLRAGSMRLKDDVFGR